MHHPLLAEVPVAVPVAVAAGEGALSLFTLLLWFIALSLLIIWRHTFGAMFVWVADELDKAAVHAFGRTIHFLGPVSSAFRQANHAIEVALSETATGAQHATLYLFNHAVHLLVLTGHTIWQLGYRMGEALQGLVHSTIPRLVDVATHALNRAIHRLGQVEAALELRVTHRISRAVAVLEHALAHDFGIARRGIDAVERETRALAKKAEREAGRLSRVEKALGVAAFAGAVAVALERLGLKWLRCPSLGNLGRKTGCKGFKFLEDLLFGVIDVLVITDLCEITRLMVDAAESRPVKGAIHAFIDGMDDLLDCRGLSRPKVWTVSRADLPPLQAWSALPPVG